MRLLLDTHAFLWFVADDPKLSAIARWLINEAAEVYVSSASIWEASIKAGSGKLDVDIGRLVETIRDSGFIELPVRVYHAMAVRHLPDIHRDPFDRMLIAQALTEPLKLVTADAQLAKYTDLIYLI
jgi:PIN domain nuclease of toxin-antitoxin system